MARTLIGTLLLRLKAEGLGEAKKVVQTLKDVENTARRMGSAGVGSWGVGFQKQLNALKLSSKDIQDVEKSWIALHESIKSRDIGKAVKRLEVSHWKTQTLAALATQKADLDKHFRDVEKKTRSHMFRMADIMKAGTVAMGFYTIPYGVGLATREGLTASSERRRELFRQQMAGIPDGEQQKLFDASEATAQKYPSIPITSVMEMSRSAFTVMGDAERAAAVLDSMAASLVVLQSARGTDAAANMLVSMIRGLDNLGANKDGQIGIDQVNDMIAAVSRATQVDPDFNPGQFFEFARATKVAGPALSMDFLARTPVFMQDMGSGSTGNALAMAFRAFVLEAVGSAGGKKYLEERDRLGIRQGGKLVDSELFGSDPDQWVLKHLVPALQKDGVDLNNDTQVAAAVGKLSGNTTATGFLTRVITQREQIERWLSMMDKAVGLEAAEDVRFEDPFVGFEAFKKAFENLSAALIPIDSINAGLNSLANGINALARIAEDNPALTALGIGGAAAGTVVGAKAIYDKLGNAFGLNTAAVALDGSAAALTRAAIALGGSAAVDGAIPGDGGGKKPGKPGIGSRAPLLVAGRWSPWVAALLTQGSTADNPYVNADAGERARMREKARADAEAYNRESIPATGRDRVENERSQYEKDAAAARANNAGKPDYKDADGRTYRELTKPREPAAPREAVLTGINGLTDRVMPPSTLPNGMIESMLSGMDRLKQEANSTGIQVKSSLEVQATPQINLGPLQEAVNLAQRFLALMNQANSAASGAAATTDRQLRRGMADYGVAP